MAMATSSFRATSRNCTPKTTTMRVLSRTLALFALLASSALATAWAALPTPHDIQTAVQAGNFTLANQEMAQVLAADPNSGKAHYIDARLLAKEGQWSRAQAELARAQQLDPAMGFVHPQTLATFTQQLQSHTTAPQSASHGLILWVILGALAFIFILAAIYRAQTRRPMVFAPGTAPYGQPQAPGYLPGANPGGYPMAQQPGMGGGPGLMGALGTGLAAGAGFAVGETLVDKLLDHGASGAGQGGIPPSTGNTSDAPIPDDQNFGLTDASSWSDDSSADSGGADDAWSDS